MMNHQLSCLNWISHSAGSGDLLGTEAALTRKTWASTPRRAATASAVESAQTESRETWAVLLKDTGLRASHREIYGVLRAQLANGFLDFVHIDMVQPMTWCDLF